ncbi:MAG: winged helix-turn-helix transcriptional regulator [Rhodospirillales bacterium]|nr:winged helix-turn-helix transcriptional regulator [Rhodospirillales bacterium]
MDPKGGRRQVPATWGDAIVKDIQENAKLASSFLKSLANENRLVILCALAEGEKNVGELEEILGVRQPTLSQQLARLRSDKMVETRRESKQIYYKLCNEDAELVLELIFELFCTGGSQDMEPRPRAKTNEARATASGDVEAA